MTIDMHEESDWEPPRRDEGGRFRKGSSGNPSGRPPKQPPTPWSMEECFAEALAEEVYVKGPDGTAQRMPVRDLLIKGAVLDAVKAKPKDKIQIVERLAKMNLLRPPVKEADAGEEIYTEEDRRLLEIVQREVLGDRCCKCKLPLRESPPTDHQDHLRSE